jgi:hypothetical protein
MHSSIMSSALRKGRSMDTCGMARRLWRPGRCGAPARHDVSDDAAGGLGQAQGGRTAEIVTLPGDFRGPRTSDISWTGDAFAAIRDKDSNRRVFLLECRSRNVLTSRG